MDRRLELQNILKNILQSDHVYFQPPPSKQIVYPCIIYSRDDVDTTRANNSLYLMRVRYTLNLIGQDPNSEFINKILELPYCSYDRSYAADGLNHDVFSLYY